jgi:hypothetical protein
MRIASRLMLSAAAVLLYANLAAAQTADEIVEKYLTAVGGRAAIGKVTSRSMTGTITVSTPGGDLSGSVELLNQQPNKSRSLVKVDASGFNLGEIVVDQRFDGSSGYILDSFQGNRDVSGDQLAAMKNGLFPNPFLDYKQRGTAIELAGREKVGDREAYVLIVKPSSGPASRQYLDAASYLPIKTVVKATVEPVGEIEQTTEFLAYREYDGIQTPVKIQNTSPVQTSTIYITKVEHNVQVDPAVFSKPAGAN